MLRVLVTCSPMVGNLAGKPLNALGERPGNGVTVIADVH